MNTPDADKRGFSWVLVGILALAFVLRMGWPGLAEFKLDEAMVARRALAIAYEGEWRAMGMGSSVGAIHPPLNLYLAATALRLWRDPLAIVLLIGLLNGLAVLACYLVGRAYFGQNVGLMASFLFAVNPWAIMYGRKIWSQNLPLATLGFFAALYATFVQGRRWALVGAWVGVAVLIGLHLGGLAFIPVLVISMFLYRKQVTRGPLLAGLALFTLALAPYVIYDALQGWPSLRGFLRYASGEPYLSWDALRYAFFLTGSAGFHGLAGGLYPEYLAGLPDLWGLNWVMMVLLALALLYGMVLVVRGPEERRRSVLLLLMWFVVPIVLQSRPTAPVYPFYFILLYPVQFFLIAILLGDLLGVADRKHGGRLASAGVSRLKPGLPYRCVLVVFLLLWGVWQVAVVGRMFVFMDRHPTTGGYGIPLKYTHAAALEAQRLAGPAEIIVLSVGVQPNVDETPTVFEALLFGHPHRFADGRWALPVPDSPQAVYVVGPMEEHPADLGPVMERLKAMGYVRPGPVVALPDGWFYRLFYRDGADREDVLAGLRRFPEALHFANGTAFLGYGMAQTVPAGGTLEVWLAWWVSAPPPPGTRYHFFAHLLDEGGALRSQHDGAGFPTTSWRAGDLVLSRFSIPIPGDLAAGHYQVWAGLYSYPDVVNVPFLDVAGNPVGERVALGKVEVEH